MKKTAAVRAQIYQAVVFVLMAVGAIFWLPEDLRAIDDSQRSITIGWIGALTGDAAAIGTDSLYSLKTATNAINIRGGLAGKTVTVLAEDDGYDISRALTAYQKLKDQVSSRIIFMSTYGALFALGHRPEQDNVIVLDTLDCNDQLAALSKNNFCVATRTESIAANFVKAIKSNGSGKVAVLYEEEAWFNFIVRGLKQALGNRLLEVQAPLQAGDYRAEITKIKKSGAQHLVLLGNDAMGKALAQAAALGLKLHYYSIASVMSPGFQALAGKAIEGTVVSHWQAERNALRDNFESLFRAQFGRYPQLEFVAMPTWDAAQLAFLALDQTLKADQNFSAAQLRKNFLGLPVQTGICGKLKFDTDGAVRSIVEKLYRVNNGQLVPWTDGAELARLE